MFVLKLPLSVDLQQKLGKISPLHDFLYFNSYFRQSFKLMYRKKWLW
jgi:hypothetical protein